MFFTQYTSVIRQYNLVLPKGGETRRVNDQPDLRTCGGFASRIVVTVSEMTYTLSSGTLYSTIPYCSGNVLVLINEVALH